MWGTIRARPNRGEELTLTCYWQSLMLTPWDYTVFVHLRDQNGDIVAQVDEEPSHFDFPTSHWQPEDAVRDSHNLSLPAELAPGSYELVIGLYRLSNQERLPITSQDPPGNELIVGSVVIESTDAS